MVTKKTIELSEEQLGNIRIELAKSELQLLDLKSKIRRTEYRLHSGFFEKALDTEIESLQKCIESKKDVSGQDVEDYLIEDLKVQLEVKLREKEGGLVEKQLAVSRQGLKEMYDMRDLTENNIKVMKKQLRTGKFIQIS